MQDSLRIYTDNVRAILLQGKLFVIEGSRQEGIRCFERALKLAPNDQYILKLLENAKGIK